MKKVMIGAACAAFGVMGVASVAGADQPISQACFGTSVSTQARTPGPYGQGVRTFTPRNGAGTLGDAIAAGEARSR